MHRKDNVAEGLVLNRLRVRQNAI